MNYILSMRLQIKSYKIWGDGYECGTGKKLADFHTGNFPNLIYILGLKRSTSVNE